MPKAMVALPFGVGWSLDSVWMSRRIWPTAASMGACSRRAVYSRRLPMTVSSRARLRISWLMSCSRDSTSPGMAGVRLCSTITVAVAR